ncbi:OB-fold domain-containing protein [Dehalococcoidia bacterium]|nr:OB-fold domain-containing protein [Dehalococcoidia bacterium]
MAYEKPLPKINAEDRAFWEATKRHSLEVPRCKDCGHIWFPPYLSCPKCISANIEYLKSSGKGEIFGCIEMHQAYLSKFQDDLPYNVALIRLAEGPLMFSNIVGSNFEEMRPGTPVEVVFDDVTDEVALPKFKIVASG